MGAGDDRSLMYALGMCDFTDPVELADALERYWNPRADPQVRRDCCARRIGPQNRLNDSGGFGDPNGIRRRRFWRIWPDLTGRIRALAGCGLGLGRQSAAVAGR